MKFVNGIVLSVIDLFVIEKLFQNILIAKNKKLQILKFEGCNEECLSQ